MMTRLLVSATLLATLTTGTAQTKGTPLSGLTDPPAAAPAAPDAPAPPLEEARLAAAKGDFPRAAALLKAEAEKGDAGAAVGYGEMLLAGRGVKADPAGALPWFERAADAGHAVGQFRQAEIYLNGAPGVPADPDRGLFLLTAAGEAGQPDALQLLGVRAESVARAADAEAERKRHFLEARGFYEKAAARDQSAALLAMSRFLDEGLGGVPPDPKAAFAMAYRACERANPLAMNEMGARYQQGRGVRKDNVAALGWFLSAAESGLPAAMVNLGNAYEAGNGVPQSFETAGAWYARAAKAGFAPGQLFLGRLFENGRGTKPNALSAWVNYSRAAAAGLQEAIPLRDALQAKISPAEIIAAQKEFPDLAPPARVPAK